MLVLGLIAALAYLIESVFGFGGTVLLLAFGALHIDFITLVHLSIWLSMLASIMVLATGWRDFSWPHIRNIMAISMPGIVLGTVLLGMFSGTSLLTAFAALMVVYALQGLLVPQWQPHRHVGMGFVMLGGLVQGLYSTGGPMVVAGYRTRFANKSELRATMAGFFLFANLWRAGQLALTGDMGVITVIGDYWLAFIGVPIGVWLGHRIHLALSEKQFRIGLLGMILLVSLFHLARSL